MFIFHKRCKILVNMQRASNTKFNIQFLPFLRIKTLTYMVPVKDAALRQEWERPGEGNKATTVGTCFE